MVKHVFRNPYYRVEVKCQRMRLHQRRCKDDWQPTLQRRVHRVDVERAYRVWYPKLVVIRVEMSEDNQIKERRWKGGRKG